MSTSLQLKVLWQKKFLGLSLNQVNKNSILPITPYYFWPRTTAWEQLKLELESKPWVSEEEKIRILNLTTDVMHFWQDSRQDEIFEEIKERFNEVTFSKL